MLVPPTVAESLGRPERKQLFMRPRRRSAHRPPGTGGVQVPACSVILGLLPVERLLIFGLEPLEWIIEGDPSDGVADWAHRGLTFDDCHLLRSVWANLRGMQLPVVTNWPTRCFHL